MKGAIHAKLSWRDLWEGMGWPCTPRPALHELMCIAFWFLVKRRVQSLRSLLFPFRSAGGRRKNGGSGHCFCPPVTDMALCQGDFWRLCPSTVGSVDSEPKGQNVTLSRKRVSCPHTSSILPRRKGSPADPRGPLTESLQRAVVWVGTGSGAWQRQRTTRRLTAVYLETILLWESWKINVGERRHVKQGLI